MQQNKTKRVVIALRLSTQAGQRTLQGIYRFLNENQTHWDVRIKRDSDEFGLANVVRYPNWGIDGIIFGMCAPDNRLDASIAEIARQKIPIVAVDVRGQKPLDERRSGIAFVNTDAGSVGRDAADFFLQHGYYRSFGYIPDSRGRIWSKLRGDAFATELKGKGFECSCYVHPPLDKDNSEDFRKWLRSLRKPAALFVACDDQALTVLEACRAARLHVPQDVSVLGVDDDEVIDESATPMLSSVRPNHERQGFIAAIRLHDLMKGKKDVQRHTEIPTLAICARNSTRNESSANVLVQNALSYIAKNVRYGLDPSAVAHHFNVSRRLLDLRFREIGGTSVGAAIRDRQLADVCNMLKTSKMSINTIADLCGFSNHNYLKTLFKSRFGTTMREWREKNRQ